MKKPWDKGWIPPPKPIRKWEGAATPEGWVRDNRSDCVEFYRPGSTLWTYDRITGGFGRKWRLHLETWSQGVFKSPDFVSSSLETLLVWYAVEKANAPEPEHAQFTVTGRQAGKSAALAFGYGFGRPAVEIGTLIHADFAALERRVCKP